MVGISLLCTLSVNAQKIPNGDIAGCYWRFTTHDGLLLIDSKNYSETLDYSHDKWENILDYIYLDQPQSKRYKNYEIKKIKIKGNIRIKDCESLFANLPNVKTIDLTGLKTDNAINMAGMFRECTKLEEIIMPNISTKNVKDMSYMFYGCNNLTFVDFSKFDISNVTTMNSMFLGCSSMISISLPKTNTELCTDLSYMFEGCTCLQSINLTGFAPKKVQYLSHMFANCDSLKTIDASNIIAYNATADFMFYNCYKATTIKFPKFYGANPYIKGIACNCNSLEKISIAKSKINVSILIDAIKGIYSATRINTIDLTDCVQNEVVASPFNSFPNVSTIISNTTTPNNLPTGFFAALPQKSTVKVRVPVSAYYAHSQANGWKDFCPERGTILTDETVGNTLPQGTYNCCDLQYTREASGDYETFCLPFTMSLTSNNDFTFYTFTGNAILKNGKYTIETKQVTSNLIPAGTPFIAKTRKGAKFTFINNVGNCTLKTSKTQHKVDIDLYITNYHEQGCVITRKISGTYETLQRDPDESLYSIETPNSLVSTNMVSPFRAYIRTPKGQDLPRYAKMQSFDISFDNDVEATGIIDVEEKKTEEDVFYNLRGQRVYNNTKGLIIKNGKKYFVK